MRGCFRATTVEKHTPCGLTFLGNERLELFHRCAVLHLHHRGLRVGLLACFRDGDLHGVLKRFTRDAECKGTRELRICQPVLHCRHISDRAVRRICARLYSRLPGQGALFAQRKMQIPGRRRTKMHTNAHRATVGCREDARGLRHCLNRSAWGPLQSRLVPFRAVLSIAASRIPQCLRAWPSAPQGRWPCSLRPRGDG